MSQCTKHLLHKYGDLSSQNPCKARHGSEHLASQHSCSEMGDKKIPIKLKGHLACHMER